MYKKSWKITGDYSTIRVQHLKETWNKKDKTNRPTYKFLCLFLDLYMIRSNKMCRLYASKAPMMFSCIHLAWFMTGYRTWGTQCFSVWWLFCRHFSARFSFIILLCVFSHRIHSLQGKIRSMTQRICISFVKLRCFINDKLLDNTLTSVVQALLNVDVNVVCVHSEENRYFQN